MRKTRLMKVVDKFDDTKLATDNSLQVEIMNLIPKSKKMKLIYRFTRDSGDEDDDDYM